MQKKVPLPFLMQIARKKTEAAARAARTAKSVTPKPKIRRPRA